MRLFAIFAGSASGALILKKQIPGMGGGSFGDADDAYVADSAERNAMFDCSNGVKAAAGATGGSNNMAMRVVAAKAAAIASQDDTGSTADYEAATKGVQKFRRHAAQDCEDGGSVKKDMTEDAPYAEKVNFSGAGSDEADAQAMAEEALDRAKGIKKDYFEE